MASSSSLQKLLGIRQSQPASRLLPFLAQNQIPQIVKPCDPTSFPDHPEPDLSKPNQSSCAHVYPSFPFGFFLDPISATSLIRIEPDADVAPDEPDADVAPDEPDATIRADSVKKKRKKKMNKHKLRKLRKRLRRKTKT